MSALSRREELHFFFIVQKCLLVFHLHTVAFTEMSWSEKRLVIKNETQHFRYCPTCKYLLQKMEDNFKTCFSCAFPPQLGTILSPGRNVSLTWRQLLVISLHEIWATNESVSLRDSVLQVFLDYHVSHINLNIFFQCQQ